MNIQEFLNEWGGYLGALIGVLGGAFGTWNSIRGTNGPIERAFMVKAAVWSWIFVFAVLGSMFGLGYVLPQSYKLCAFLPMLLLVPVLLIGIPMCNRRQAQIRAKEAREKSQ